MASVPGRDRTEAGFALDPRINTRSAGETLMIRKVRGLARNKVLLGITSMMLYAILGHEQSIGHKRNEDPIDHKPTDPGETGTTHAGERYPRRRTAAVGFRWRCWLSAHF